MNSFRATTSQTMAIISGTRRRQAIRPTHRLRVSRTVIVLRIQGRMFQGRSPGSPPRRSAISSSEMSRLVGSSAMTTYAPNSRCQWVGCSNNTRPTGEVNLRVGASYFRLSANALPRAALEAWAPAQNGTAVSANSLWEFQTSAKNSFSSAFFSRLFLAAAIYSVK